jgi:hypothetical protein
MYIDYIYVPIFSDYSVWQAGKRAAKVKITGIIKMIDSATIAPPSWLII